MIQPCDEMNSNVRYLNILYVSSIFKVRFKLVISDKSIGLDASLYIYILFKPVCTGHKPAHTWLFLCRHLYVCMCLCVCLPPRLLTSRGKMWCNIDLI